MRKRSWLCRAWATVREKQQEVPPGRSVSDSRGTWGAENGWIAEKHKVWRKKSVITEQCLYKYSQERLLFPYTTDSLGLGLKQWVAGSWVKPAEGQQAVAATSAWSRQIERNCRAELRLTSQNFAKKLSHLSKQQRQPHKATHLLLGPMSEINGVINSLDFLSLLATEGLYTPHLEELPRYWLVLDGPSIAFNWIHRASLPTPYQSVSPPSSINKHIFQQDTCQAYQGLGNVLLAQLS